MTKADIENIVENVSFIHVSFGGQNDKFARLLCIKRKEFAHEEEVRILVYDNKSIGENGCYIVPFDAQIVLDDICVDPRLNDDEFLMHKRDFIKLGCTLPIIQSDLYKVDMKPIRLDY